MAALRAHLLDREVLAEDKAVGVIYKVWEGFAEREGLNHPDTRVLARAYMRSLERGKHGGLLVLPLHLHCQFKKKNVQVKFATP